MARVVLFHALAREANSMRPLARFLAERGHGAHAIRFGTVHRSLAAVAQEAAASLQSHGLGDGGSDVAYVGHSLGGLVVRMLARQLPGFAWRGGVLLGSPIRGTVIAERGRHWLPLRALYGRVLDDMTPDAVARLPPPPGRFGTVAGTRWTPLLPAAHLTRALAPGEPSDSTVLVRETRHGDAADHVEVHACHFELPAHAAVHAQVAHFLEHGRFDHAATQPGARIASRVLG